MTKKRLKNKTPLNQNADMVKQALYKKAVGYMTEEIIEEYNLDDNCLKLIKKKVTQKEVAPDIPAARTLLEINNSDDLSLLTDDQLREEVAKLINLIVEEGYYDF